MSVLNKFVIKQNFKFEDWKLAIQYFREDSYLYKFDLRSGYHHFDICPQQQTYIGFSWNGKYFLFLVKQSLVDAGLLINEEKSMFVPTQKLDWLGILWDSQIFSLSVPDRRISDLSCLITHIIDLFPVFNARELAQVTGKVISLSPVVGNLTRLMARHCYMSIETRSCWDTNLFLVYPSEILRELYFWKDNAKSVNCKKKCLIVPHQ